MILDKKRLEEAAKDYCGFWYQYDSKFSDYIAGQHYPIAHRVDKLRECLCAYGIQRNVQPNNTDLKNHSGNSCGESYNPKKHQVILEVLDNFESSDDWVSDIYRLENILVCELSNDVRLLSLASKILWQKVKGKHLVYDSDARKALKIADKDILGFYGEWNIMYKQNYQQIVSALESVIDESPFMFYRYDDYRKDWFYRRIFDTYLINLTRSKK